MLTMGSLSASPSKSKEPSSRSRLLLDQRTPAEIEISVEAKETRRRTRGRFWLSLTCAVVFGALLLYIFAFSPILTSTLSTPWSLSKINLPNGFKIEEYAKGNSTNKMLKPRSLYVSEYEGSIIVYVGSDTAFVYALIDYNSDGQNDAILQIWQSTQSFSVHSIAVNEQLQVLFIDDMNGNIWQCANVHQQVLSFQNQEERLSDCSIFVSMPYASISYMNINPQDGNLCVSLLPNRDSIEGSIRCFNGYDGVQSLNDSLVYAHGVGNSLGFEFHPTVSDQLWCVFPDACCAVCTKCFVCV